MHPDFAISHLRLGRAYAAKNMYAEAAAEFESFSRLAGQNTLALASLVNATARLGNHREAMRLLSDLRAMLGRQHVPAYQLAIAYAGLGDADQCMAWLTRAYDERNDFLVVLNNEPLFDGLRTDRRFLELERRIGLDPRRLDSAKIAPH